MQRDLLGLVARYPLRWPVPAVLIAGAVVAYACVGSATWEASQALIVRNEAAGDRDAPGRFNQTDEMKTVQETILELAKSQSVLTDALAPRENNLANFNVGGTRRVPQTADGTRRVPATICPSYLCAVPTLGRSDEKLDDLAQSREIRLLGTPAVAFPWRCA